MGSRGWVGGGWWRSRGLGVVGVQGVGRGGGVQRVGG